MTRISARISAISILIALVASGFVGLSPNANASTSDTFVNATIGEPQYLDPAVDWDSSGMEIIENVYETLIGYDKDRADVFVPVLATEVPSVENGLISADGMTYTLHVRSGVTFHDGSTLTADDVAYSFQRVLRIHDFSGPSWMLEQVLTDYVSYGIGTMTVAEFLASSYEAPWMIDVLEPLGADHIVTEEDSQAIAEAAVVKVDSMTVMFRLTHPYAGFVSILAATVSSIVSMDFVEANGGVQNGMQNDFMNWNTCGSGPYTLASWEIGIQIHLTRNDAYWGAAPALKDVYLVQVNDINTRIMMLQSGDADASYITPDYESVLAGNPDVTIIKGIPTFTMNFIGFNMNINTEMAATWGSTVPSDFFQEKNVRQAFVHLMNCQALIDSFEHGNALLPNGPIPYGMFGYDPAAPVYQYDVAMAAQYLQAAVNPATGDSWWADGFTIAFIFNAGNLLREEASMYLKMAIESLNGMPEPHGVFQATVNALDWPTYLTQMRMRPSPLPVLFLGWTQDYSDPDDYVASFLQTGMAFAAGIGYSNPDMDALIISAAGEMDPAIRQILYQQITALCYDDAPYIWLSQTENFQVLRSWVTGYYFNPMFDGLRYATLAKNAPPGIEVTKLAGKPSASATTWSFDATSDGVWSLEIENKGLSTILIVVHDLTTGKKVESQAVSFMKYGAYPTGTLTAKPVYMEAGHSYKIVVTPTGKTGASALLMEHFVA